MKQAEEVADKWEIPPVQGVGLGAKMQTLIAGSKQEEARWIKLFGVLVRPRPWFLVPFTGPKIFGKMP